MVTALCLLVAGTMLADEGMWMLGNLNKETRKSMKELGLQLPAGKLYNPKRASLKDAVVSFGGFCSGVVVSEDGLVLTNHHCGFSSVQQHSSVDHDYLRDGFVARSREEELPNPDLYVRFLLRTEDVTKRVLKAVKPDMTEAERTSVVDSMMMVIGSEVSDRDSTLTGVVDAYYGGNEFWLSVYRDYNDVRLVFAPPSSVGKFGWDQDNWEWPRHTGDFCVFRIYAGKDNQPAEYSPENVPYHPRYVAPVSLQGYREGDFCMTLGYPGSTERYLSSFGIEEMMNNSNQAQIDIRGIKQAIWKREMDRRDDIRIKYASKYDESSNYWKNSIGVNRAIRKLHVLEKKRQLEDALRQWIRNTPEEREQRRKTGPLTSERVLDGVLRGLGSSPDQARLSLLWRHWEIVMGPGLAPLARPLGHRDAMLLVGADDAMSLQELHLQSDEILERVNAFMEKPFFRTVKVSLILGKTELDGPLRRAAAFEEDCPPLPRSAADGRYLGGMDPESPVARAYARFAARRR